MVSSVSVHSVVAKSKQYSFVVIFFIVIDSSSHRVSKEGVQISARNISSLTVQFCFGPWWGFLKAGGGS